MGIVEPKEAVEAFQRRGLLRASYRWQDVWQEEHSRAFAVAGVSKIDVLELFYDELKPAIAAGRRLPEFAKAMEAKLVAKGFWGDVEVTDPKTGDTRITRFDPARLELIHGVNTRQSFAAGRWERIERLKGRFPYVMYRTMRDGRVRDSHKPWDGVTLPVDHPFWNTHFPPCGWRCRCTAFGIDDKGIERYRKAGFPVKTEAPQVDWVTYVNPHTEARKPVPRGIDPGFGYNPGKARDASSFQAMVGKAAQSHPGTAAEVMARAVADRPAMVAAATAAFGPWADALLATERTTGEIFYVSVLRPEALRVMAERGIEPRSAAIAVRDKDAWHAMRDTKDDKVARALYRRLPTVLENATAALLEPGTTPPAVLYVVDHLNGDGLVDKFVVIIDMPVKANVDGKGKRGVLLNLVRTAKQVNPDALRDRKQYVLLWGSLK